MVNIVWGEVLERGEGVYWEWCHVVGVRDVWGVVRRWFEAMEVSELGGRKGE